MKKERNTRQKKLILEAVRLHHDHPTADQIYLDVREKDEKISRGTVYRNLNRLTKNGEIADVEVSPANRFDCRLDKHYHMVCTVCGEVSDAPLEYEEQEDRRLEELTGFSVERHETTFRGICRKCMETRAQSADDAER